VKLETYGVTATPRTRRWADGQTPPWFVLTSRAVPLVQVNTAPHNLSSRGQRAEERTEHLQLECGINNQSIILSAASVVSLLETSVRMQTQQASAASELQHLLAVPPSTLDVVHHGNPIAVAHAVLQAIRDAGDERFLFLRTVMEVHQHWRQDQEELFFHCVTGCRQVVLAQWGHYSSAFLRGLRDYFMMLGHHLTQTRSCRLACYTTAVSLWKRGWNDPPKTAEELASPPVRADEVALLEGMAVLQAPVLHGKNDLFQYLETLFHSQPQQAAAFLSCLVGEFSGKSAVSYRLPLEFHKTAHRSFEKEGALNHALRLSMQTLGQIVSRCQHITPQLVEEAHAIIQLVLDVMAWEFGISAWATGSLGALTTGQTLIRPPVEWRDYLARPDLARIVFHVHQKMAAEHEMLAHSLRQLLLVLASLSGPIFSQDGTERKEYASNLAEGTLELLKVSSQAPEESSCLLDTLQLVSRIVANFRLSILVTLPTMIPLLQGLAAVGTKLLADQVKDCEQASGDVESMEHGEWREEAFALLIEAAVLLCGDPWILYSETEESRKEAQQSLSTVLGPLYEGFVRSRTRMAALEEHYAVSHETDLDEVREEITEAGLEEELASVATMGRLNLSAAIACLSNLFANTMPQLESLWHGSGEVTPETAALLEQARLLNMYITHLLTDNNHGETPSIPDAVIIACKDNPGLAAEISSAVQAVFKFADAQVRKIAENPSNRRLSPFLASSFLLFLNRWAPAYICPVDTASSRGSNLHLQEWSAPDKAQQAVSFCISLCLHYQCYWPLEQQVQEHVGDLLMSLAKRGPVVRALMVASPAFHQMVQFHCLTAGIRHSAPREEFEAVVGPKVGDLGLQSMNMMWGFQSLPYVCKGRVVTAILVACSDMSNQTASAMINDSLKAIHDAFTSLIQALSTKQVSFDDVNAKEMSCLCVEMIRGIAHASEMADPERIPQLLTTYLPQLSSLMTHYATDLSICETLLRFFRDYTEHFIATLDRDQSLTLLNASAELLKGYSTNHCGSRAIIKKSAVEADAEEEQAYSDILCAIQLLINLGTKDFIDACGSQNGVDSAQVTDMIFFGLQQILPLMTQGLLQFPTLCSQFFELIGFMMDTYPEKVCVLPYELFNSLLESLLFGMSHQDAQVANCSLYGLGSIAREHLSSQILKPHLDAHPEIFDQCSKRLLSEVVFQTVVVDRVEAAGMALLPLAAVDVNRFAQVVQQLTAQVPDAQQQTRLQAAFHTLIQPEALAKVSTGGYEGRMNRAQFKTRFVDFVNEVHSFLVIR
jgi:hypothetical protein